MNKRDMLLFHDFNYCVLVASPSAACLFFHHCCSGYYPDRNVTSPIPGTPDYLDFSGAPAVLCYAVLFCDVETT